MCASHAPGPFKGGRRGTAVDKGTEVREGSGSTDPLTGRAESAIAEASMLNRGEGERGCWRLDREEDESPDTLAKAVIGPVGAAE